MWYLLTITRFLRFFWTNKCTISTYFESVSNAEWNGLISFPEFRFSFFSKISHAREVKICFSSNFSGEDRLLHRIWCWLRNCTRFFISPFQKRDFRKKSKFRNDRNSVTRGNREYQSEKLVVLENLTPYSNSSRKTAKLSHWRFLSIALHFRVININLTEAGKEGFFPKFRNEQYFVWQCGFAW